MHETQNSIVKRLFESRLLESVDINSLLRKFGTSEQSKIKDHCKSTTQFTLQNAKVVPINNKSDYRKYTLGKGNNIVIVDIPEMNILSALDKYGLLIAGSSKINLPALNKALSASTKMNTLEKATISKAFENPSEYINVSLGLNFDIFMKLFPNMKVYGIVGDN